MSGLRVVVLGLSLSSSWGNGHATTFRALLKAFAARGHEVVFYAWDAPWYGGEAAIAWAHSLGETKTKRGRR